MNEKLQVLESEIDRRLQLLNALRHFNNTGDQALFQIGAITSALEEIKKLR